MNHEAALGVLLPFGGGLSLGHHRSRQWIAQSLQAFDALPLRLMIDLVTWLNTCIQSMIQAGFAIDLFGVVTGTLLCHPMA